MSNSAYSRENEESRLDTGYVGCYYEGLPRIKAVHLQRLISAYDVTFISALPQMIAVFDAVTRPRSLVSF